MLYDHTIYSPNDTQTTIRDFLANLSDTVYLNEEMEFKIKIIVGELVTNCFKHDEQNSWVRFMAKPRGHFISIVLMEDGIGFDVSAALRSCVLGGETASLCENGRGLYIVSTLSDVLRYNRKGNIIAIHVNLV